MRLVAYLAIAVLFCFTAAAHAMVTGLGRPSTMPTQNPIACQVWHNVPGAQATDTLDTPLLQRPADAHLSLETMEFAPQFHDQWACSLSALIVPPITGRYVFCVAGRDSAMLFLSSDANPARRKYIAETPSWTDIHTYRWYSAQVSQGIELEAGQHYFIQLIGKCGPGPGAMSVAWIPPGGKMQAPIPRDRFRPYWHDVSVPDLRVHHVALTLAPLPPPATQPVTQAGEHYFVRGAHFEVDGESQDLSYLMFMPHAWDTGHDPLPMLVFLHGNNRQGYLLTNLEKGSPLRNIEANAKLRDWMPMIVMCPELPPDWRWDTPGAGTVVNQLVDQLCKRYPRIDRKRIYLTGLSMGGKGTWETLEDSPQTYAAAAPISAVDVRPDQVPTLLKDLPHLHIICGGMDHGFADGSHRMYFALRPVLGDRVEFTVFEHEGHNVWDHFYSSQSFYEEMMRYSR